uniref:Site-specific recombinase XerD n=1 Tax=Desulfovibrio sp. U5L TaxID=596152 RepID=I2PZB6_9BACT
MAKQERIKTDYPGVYYVMGTAVATGKPERIFYIFYRKGGRQIEEKAGRQFQDNMTASKASRIRAERIEGNALSNQGRRDEAKAAKEAEEGRWTIAKLWEAYKAGKPGLKGIVTDENRYKNFIRPPFGGKAPAEIIALDVDRLRIKLLKTHRPGTVKNVLELLRRIINYGCKKNLCPGPGFVVELPRAQSLKTEDLAPEELAELLKAIDEDDHPFAGPIMKLALFSGMRKSEMLKLQWSNIDFRNGVIHLPDAKSGQDEKIPLSDTARELLESLPRTSDFVFPGRAGGQRVYIQRYVNAIRDKAGLPRSFRALHGLRHVYASLLASSGRVDMYTLQKLLTHKSPMMTQRYAHLRDDAMKQAADVAGEIVNGIQSEAMGLRAVK